MIALALMLTVAAPQAPDAQAPQAAETQAPNAATHAPDAVAVEPVSLAPLPLPPAPPPPDGTLTRSAVPGSPASLPPVTAQMFQLSGRVELWPMVSVSLGDAFFRTLAAGARGEVHLNERWSIGGHGLFGASIVDAPVSVCGASCADASRAALKATPGQLDVLLGAEGSFVPIYGKLSLAGEKTIHFDTYVSLGPELVRMRIAQDASSPLESSWAMGGRFSLGQRFFIGQSLAIRVAASELVYGAQVRGIREIERQLSLEGGVAWLFGSSK